MSEAAPSAASIEALQERLEELLSTLDAIRLGEVDALVTQSPAGERVFTLKSADQPYRILVEAMNEGAAMLDSEGIILYCNFRFARMLDSPAELVTGRSLFDFIADEERDGCADLLRSGLEAPCHCESHLRNGAGQYVPVMLSVNKAIVDENVTLCLVATDLTVQKRNEQIIASEKLARSILEQAMESIVVCDDAGRIIRANEAARKLADVRVGRLLDDALPLSVAGDDKFSLSAVLAGNRMAGIEAALDGTTLLVSAAPLIAQNGQLIGAVVTLTDISQLKRYERVLHEKSEQLARSNADLERFAFAASHDLQEPLRMVTAYSQLLAKKYGEQVGPEAAFYSNFVETGAERMRQLIADLVTYSHVTQGPQPDLEPVEMDEVVAVTLAELEPVIRDAGALVVADKLPAVQGDRLRIAQLVSHLIENAVKYNVDGVPRVYISAERGHDQHTFSVIDNGPGVAAEYHDQIFALFKRLHGKQVPGSGTGLALCRRIVEVHGGRIWVESEAGKGATFRFTLPAARE